MRNTFLLYTVYLSCCFLFCNSLIAQQISQSIQNQNSKTQIDIRGKNAVSIAAGTSVLNGDFAEPLFEIYTHIGYKRFLGPYVNVNFGYQKFNLAYKDEFNEGFMSFDMNLELYLFPHHSFTPFVFAGGGLNASNFFTRTDSKIQGGGGFELLVTVSVGIKLFAEYNYLFTDDLDGKISGDADDAYWRAGLGLNFYFGKRGKHKKLKKNEPTIINSNPIIHYKN
jgi:hypothetical protein